MKDLTKIHDKCLEHEIAIDMSVEKLEDMRIKAFKSGDIEQFCEIIPTLNAVIGNVEEYKGFLLEKFYIREVGK